ncbi:hypothetical protein [Bacillus gaemokensis]|uniref:RpiR family transcriptional regulator n=1 Tax=Bacillus gaemokensis TaxID=574375 RepID=A0A073KCF8_9BACI|nr:hypothetical protein [Bacillus gaemokensis]KEK24280.1 RpiR family transcriptional regulator [Bacillus gaemokensis]
MRKWKLVYQLVVMVIVIMIGIVNYSSSLGNWAWFTACIGVFFILQTLTEKYKKTAR